MSTETRSRVRNPSPSRASPCGERREPGRGDPPHRVFEPKGKRSVSLEKQGFESNAVYHKF